MSLLRSSALAFLVVLGTGWAADDAVEISAVRHPVDKSYRKMVKGLDLFEEMHGLAPEADLRIGALYVVDDRVDVAIPVAADYTFTLPRDLAKDAIVRAELRVDTMTWRADIRTPGLPADTRRLGDLRLECLVGVQAGLTSQYPSFISQLLTFLESPREFCGRAEVPYLFFAERPLFAVTLHAGERKKTLSIGNLCAGIAHGRTLAQERKYCDCEADVRAAFGDAAVIRLGNGCEVWAYDFGPQQKPRLARDELVLLFDSGGSVLAVRHRQ